MKKDAITIKENGPNSLPSPTAFNASNSMYFSHSYATPAMKKTSFPIPLNYGTASPNIPFPNRP
jgi:hypothetical protein